MRRAVAAVALAFVAAAAGGCHGGPEGTVRLKTSCTLEPLPDGVICTD